MRPLKLHWAASKPNFGDWLSPAICSFLSGRKVAHAKITRCDLAAIGSLLQRKKEGLWQRSIHIWGSGFIQHQNPQTTRHHFHAVRGKLSAGLVIDNTITVFGDPGLLIDQLLPDRQSNPVRKYRVGVIPHYRDRNDPALTAIEALAKSKIIDVMQDPLVVAREILQCEFILSSSLHGLVVADSLGIPNQWLQFSDNVRGSGWKFRDYYSAFGLDQMEPLAPTTDDIQPHRLSEVIESYDRPGLDLIKQKLTNAFPFPKGRIT